MLLSQLFPRLTVTASSVSCCSQVKEYLADPSAFASAAPAASEEKAEAKEEAKQEVGGCTCLAFVWLATACPADNPQLMVHCSLCCHANICNVAPSVPAAICVVDWYSD